MERLLPLIPMAMVLALAGFETGIAELPAGFKEDQRGITPNISIAEQDLVWVQLVRDRGSDAETVMHKSWAVYLWNISKFFIPGYSIYINRQVANPTFSDVEFDAYTYMPYLKKITYFSETMDRLIADNPIAAVRYAYYIRSPLSEQRVQLNLYSGIQCIVLCIIIFVAGFSAVRQRHTCSGN